jgi:hypothetical protein
MQRVIPLRSIARMLAGLALCLAAWPALAETSALDTMLKLDDQLAIKKLQDELSGAGPGGSGARGAAAAPASAPVATAARPRPEPPVLTAVYGTVIDGRANLRGVITWDQVDYSIRVGSRVRGYTVTSISTHGALLSLGKKTFAVPLAIDAPVARAAPDASATAQVPGLIPSSSPPPVIVPMASLMRAPLRGAGASTPSDY